MFLWGIPGFEFKRLLIKRNLIVMGIVFILLAFLCWDGISDYEKILANKKPFQEMEREKVSMHLHYTFYGVRGIRLLFIPSPLSVMFNDSAVFDGMIASADSAEKLEISNSFKGKDLFSDSGGLMDFAGIMLLISAFLALICGWDGTRNREYLKFIYEISGCPQPGFYITLARIFFLNLVFWIIGGFAFLFLLINGLNTFNIYYVIYILVLTVVITSFVMMGALIGTLKSKTAQLITMPVLYFLLVLLTPWLLQRVVYMEAKEGIKSIYEYEYQNFKNAINFEKRFYDRFKVWKSGSEAPEDVKSLIQDGQKVEYKAIREAELNRMSDIVKRIKIYQFFASLCPTTFYISTNKELSSKGFQNFMDFYRYSFEMKQNFIKFYIDRKFNHPLPQNGVEPFIKGDDDIFFGKSRLPKYFLIGIVLNLTYIAVLLFFLFRRQSGLSEISEKTNKEQVSIAVDFNNSSSIFVLCRSESIKNKIFEDFKIRKNTVCIDKIPIHFQMSDLRADWILSFLCKISGVNKETAQEYLNVLGLTNLNKKFVLSPEDILKFYAVIRISGNDGDEIIMNDFFKQKSREFEASFFKLFKILETSGKKIVYLSCEMYYPRYKANGKLKEEYETESFPIDYEKITLR